MHRGPGLPLDYPVKQGIRIIKLFAWEKDFVSKIDKSRSDEMRSLRGYMVRYFRWLCFLSRMLALLTAVVRLLLSSFFIFRWPHLEVRSFYSTRKAHGQSQWLVNDYAYRSAQKCKDRSYVFTVIYEPPSGPCRYVLSGMRQAVCLDYVRSRPTPLRLTLACDAVDPMRSVRRISPHPFQDSSSFFPLCTATLPVSNLVMFSPRPFKTPLYSSPRTFVADDDGRCCDPVELCDDVGGPVHVLGAHEAAGPHAHCLPGLHLAQPVRHPSLPAARAPGCCQLLPPGEVHAAFFSEKWCVLSVGDCWCISRRLVVYH